MKFKDIKKRYGLQFMFKKDIDLINSLTDSMPISYIVLNTMCNNISIARLENGIVATFSENDTIMEDDIIVIK